MSPRFAALMRCAACWLATNARAHAGGHHRVPAPRRLLPERRRPGERAVLHHPLVAAPGDVDQDVEPAALAVDALEHARRPPRRRCDRRRRARCRAPAAPARRCGRSRRRSRPHARARARTPRPTPRLAPVTSATWPVRTVMRDGCYDTRPARARLRAQRGRARPTPARADRCARHRGARRARSRSRSCSRCSVAPRRHVSGRRSGAAGGTASSSRRSSAKAVAISIGAGAHLVKPAASKSAARFAAEQSGNRAPSSSVAAAGSSGGGFVPEGAQELHPAGVVPDVDGGERRRAAAARGSRPAPRRDRERS